MRTEIGAYIDTNVIIYAVLHHPERGEASRRVLEDVQRGVIEGYGSMLVAIELLGALSRYDPVLARHVVADYLKLNVRMLEIDELALGAAGIINTVVNMRYDAVHLALMLLNGVDTVITYDLDDWRRAESRMGEIAGRLNQEGYEVAVKSIKVVIPEDHLRGRMGWEK